MASITRNRKHELSSEEIAAVQLSNRRTAGEYVTYTALSRDGRTDYTVTMRDGQSLGCTCPAQVKCRHMIACEFEEQWSSPVALSDLPAHIDDSDLAEIADEIEAEMASGAWAILAAEKEAQHAQTVERPYVHADDALYAALVFGTVNTVAEMCKRADMMEHMVRNSLYHLAAGNRVIVKQIDGERFFVDTPTQGYRTTYARDFAA